MQRAEAEDLTSFTPAGNPSSRTQPATAMRACDHTYRTVRMQPATSTRARDDSLVYL